MVIAHQKCMQLNYLLSLFLADILAWGYLFPLAGLVDTNFILVSHGWFPCTEIVSCLCLSLYIPRWKSKIIKFLISSEMLKCYICTPLSVVPFSAECILIFSFMARWKKLLTIWRMMHLVWIQYLCIWEVCMQHWTCLKNHWTPIIGLSTLWRGPTVRTIFS